MSTTVRADVAVQLRVVTPAGWLADEFAVAAPATVEVVHDYGFDVPADAAGLFWWCPQQFAVRLLASGVDPVFSAPGPDFAAELPMEVLGRRVEVFPFGLVRRSARTGQPIDGTGRWLAKPVHAKLAEAKLSRLPAAVYQDLAGFVAAGETAGLPDNASVQLSDPVSLAVEARCFIVDGQVTASSVYLADGVTWDGFDVVPDSRWAATFADDVIADLTDLPAAFALDVARTPDDELLVVEANPAWCANPYHADRAAVLEAILASQQRRTGWGWQPDAAMSMFARPLPAQLV